jgi:hypothetical protein
MPIVVALLIGWPFVGLSLIAAGIGLARRRPRFLAAAGLLMLPITLYLAATPRFRWYPLLLPVLLVTSAATVGKFPRLATALFLPVVGFVGYLLLIVLLSRSPQ